MGISGISGKDSRTKKKDLMRPTLAMGSESTRKKPVDYGPPEVKKAFNPSAKTQKKQPIDKQESVGN